jgi:hypothetical protein
VTVAELRGGERTEVEVSLQRAATLETQYVYGKRSPRRPNLDELERRRRSGWGRYLTPEDIRKVNGIFISDVLRTVPRVFVDNSDLDRRPLIRRGIRTCAPGIFIDGVRQMYANYPGAGGIDNLVSLDEILMIEVYTSRNFAPAQYATHDCGLILIWRK